MIKKLVKYGKISMALFLIASLTLPSYATVGAADGSAFVTKAEFDAALSDFNARLTTFEAGINSKIDSQVSSYLDRNGIWNGKAQGLTWTSKSLESAVAKEYILDIVTNQGNRGSFDFYKGILINSCNKSGLIAIDWAVTDIFLYCHAYCSSATQTNHYGGMWGSTAWLYDFTKDNAGNSLYTQVYGGFSPFGVFGLAQGTTDQKPMIFYSCKGAKIHPVTTFFVKSGDPVYFHGYYFHNFHSTYGSTNWAREGSGTHTVNVYSAQIY